MTKDNLYRYDIYITGHLKNVQEFIMFISDTASMFVKARVFDAVWMHVQHLTTVFKTNQVTHSVEFNDCSLTEILKDNDRIPQSMGLSYLPTYRVVLRTYLPIRDDVMKHAKGIVDASRYAFTHRGYFQPNLNNFYSVYNLWCWGEDQNEFNYSYPIRPDFTLKQIYRRDKIFNKNREYFKVGSSVFVHKIEFSLEPNGYFNSEVFRSINPVKNDPYDFIMDNKASIYKVLQEADHLYCETKCPKTCDIDGGTGCHVPPELYDDFIKTIYTANLRTETPNTYYNGRRRAIGDGLPGNCQYYDENYDYWPYSNLPNIRISKEYVHNLYSAKVYAYIYYVNLKKYAIECFLSDISPYKSYSV